MSIAVVLAAILLAWQWQRSNPAALIYLYIIAAVLVAVVIGLMTWKYLKIQRCLRALDIAAIDTIDPFEFEHYVALLLKRQRFTNIWLTERFDYGVDSLLERKVSPGVCR